MRRITVTFSDQEFNLLQENATKKGVSLARYLRDLVDTGRQVEAVSAQQTAPGSTKNKPSISNDAKALWENSLLCDLESRYLLRYLVDNLEQVSREKRDVVLNTVKEKAQALVAELLTDQ